MISSLYFQTAQSEIERALIEVARATETLALIQRKINEEAQAGIEPASLGYKASVLPLNYNAKVTKGE